MQDQAGYALFIDIAGKKVVVVGGGPVAQRKVETLMPFNPQIVVVSPEMTPALRTLAEEGRIEAIQRAYRQGDLRNARMVFSACGDPAVDDLVRAEAEQERALLNVVDVPEKCEFIVPSTMVRGPLRIAVSTSGCAPTEAKRIRRQLEERFDESWEPYLLLMQQVRELVKARITESDAVRKPVFEAAAAAGWRERLAAGEQISPEAAYAEAVAAAGAAGVSTGA